MDDSTRDTWMREHQVERLTTMRDPFPNTANVVAFLAEGSDGVSVYVPCTYADAESGEGVERVLGNLAKMLERERNTRESR